MKVFHFLSILLLLMISNAAFSMSATSHKYDQCPKEKDVRFQLYEASRTHLLSLLSHGEGGKLDTPQKQEAADKYHFYAECLKRFGDIPLDAQPGTPVSLSKCDARFDESTNILNIDMEVEEKEAYDSLKRVEISIRNTTGQEFFRAMNNRTEHPAPIPPNAFGVYPVGEKENLTFKDVKSAGHGAQIPVMTKYGHLLPGCAASWKEGKLHIHWKIALKDWILPDGKIDIFAKVVPANGENVRWYLCAASKLSQFKTMNNRPESHLGKSTIVPYFLYRDTGKKAKEGMFSQLTLIHLKRISAQGTIQRWPGDKISRYTYKELSRETVNLEKLPNHKLMLSPGFYRFEYNDVERDPPVGFYGKSGVFEVQAGKVIEIPVWVESAL